MTYSLSSFAAQAKRNLKNRKVWTSVIVSYLLLASFIWGWLGSLLLVLWLAMRLWRARHALIPSLRRAGNALNALLRQTKDNIAASTVRTGRAVLRISAFFFTFNGRFDRRRYLGALAAYALYGFAWLVIDESTLGDGVPAVTRHVVAGLAVIPVALSAGATGVKRLHDRAKSAWWLVVFYLAPIVAIALCTLPAVPEGLRAVVLVFVIPPYLLWVLFELACRSGTAGPNRPRDEGIPLLPPRAPTAI